MNHELQRMWEKAAIACERYYPNIFLEGLRNSRSVSQDLNLGPPD